MNIYLETETNFKTNGLGFLTDCLTANVVEELNGEYSLTLTYPINGHLNEYLEKGNIIKTNVGDNNYQLFRIKSIEKNFKTITIYAIHIFYDLTDNFIEDTAPQNLNCYNFTTWILDKTTFKHNFTVYSDITSLASARYVRRNPVECIMGDIDNSIINIFGAELERDNFNIRLLKQRGSDNHVKLLIGKNIKDITISVDVSSLYTKILPIGYDGLMLPEKYIDSPLINNYPTPKIVKYEFSDIKYDPDDEDAYHTLEEAYDALRTATYELFDAGIDKPVINIKIDWLELSKAIEYYNKYSFLEKVRLGDSITAEILGLSYNTRVIKTTYNVLTDNIDTFEIGTFKASFQNTVNNITKEITNINPSSILNQAKNQATLLLTSAMGGYVYKTNNELFIMDTDNPATAGKIWRWNLNGLGYSKTGINGPYETAITQDGSIVADFITSGKINTNLIEGYDELFIKVTDSVEEQNKKLSQITMTVDGINSKIQDISDFTVAEGNNNALVTLKGINQSEPIMIKIYPINENISYLYPNDNLFPSDDLFLKTRTLRFLNTTTGEYVDYELPDDLLYYDDNTYDEFYLDYDSQTCQITKRCEYNADGSVYVLDKEQIISYEYPQINLTDGDYEVSLLGYENGYLNVRLMCSNIYTAQLATRSELQTAINQTKEEIDLQASRKVGNDEVISKINLSTEKIVIDSNKVDIDGIATFTNNKLAEAGSTTINGSNITTGTINGNNVNVTNINASNITSGTIDANNITVKNVVAASVAAENITGTTISGKKLNGGSIDIGNSSYYLRMGASYTSNPEVSGLNVGAKGITMNNHGISNCNSLSNSKGDLYLASNSGTVHIGHSVAGSSLPIEVSGSKVYINQYLDVTTNSFYVRKKNGSTISLSDYINEASSRKVKENIKLIDENFIVSIYNEIKELTIYSYDYKKEFVSNDNERKNRFGFMIDDVIDKNIAKLLDIETDKNYSTYSSKGLAKLDLIIIKELMKKIDKLEKEVELLKESDKK